MSPLAEADERALIEALRRGDPAALQTIHAWLGDSMQTLAASMLRDRTEAEDVVEETLVRVHRAGRGFRGERGVKTWTLRIVANLCRDRLRRRRFTAGSLDDDERPIESAGLRLDPVEQWDQALDQRVFAEALERAIARLPEDQREVVLLRHRLGLSYEEIVESLGLPMGTVKSRLARALDALRLSLKELER